MTDLPAHIEANPRLGAWLGVDDGVVLVRVGKVELGQGIQTAVAQVAADALCLPLSTLRVVPARTDGGPDQGMTSGSLSVTQTTPALRHVGGVVRALTGGPGFCSDAAYVARIATLDPDTDLRDVAPEPAGPSVVVGTDAARLDLPDKVLGRPRFLTDLRPPGLLHGRVLRPPSHGARLVEVSGEVHDGATVVRDGSFVGVVAEREADADRALDLLRAGTAWTDGTPLPDEDDLRSWLQEGPHELVELADEADRPGATHTASYSRPFLLHASIAPSCAMARWADDELHVWSHSQGIRSLAASLARVLDLAPERVLVEHVENAGCYGHNGADDAALDAALLARAVPGRPVLLRWSRADELSAAPLSSAMTGALAATLTDGRIAGWEYDVWSLGHTARPGSRGTPALLAGAHLATPVALPDPTDPPQERGGGSTRNAVPLYGVGPRRMTGHRRVGTPFRASAMRSLGAYFNVFAIESFMDELAEAAGADPVEFRLTHLTDPRGSRVVETAAAMSGWVEPLPDGHGRGLGFARYKDRGAYCAVVAEVEAETDVRVRRLTVVADLGLVVNPDGARNQLEGGAIQSTSWTIRERVRFDRSRITSRDWESYPILRFTETPEVTAHLVESDQPPLGSGEAAQGPTAAAIANAVHRAIGVRVRDLPLDAAAIVRAIEADQ